MDDNTRQTASDLTECLTALGATARPMFGGFTVYVDDKVVGLVCDGRVFVKPSGADADLARFAESVPAYPGAKNSWRLPEHALRDDPDRIVAFFRATADALPPRPARRRR